MADNKKAVSVDILSYFRSKLLNDIKIPTKVSELENDSGYLTRHQDLSAYAKKSDIPVTVIDGVITFSNGLKITCNEETGEVTFTL